MELPPRPSELQDKEVAAWSEPVVIPTYPVAPPDRNPMFLERRVYQGSSGRVYPNPFTDRVASEIVDHSWQAIHLENEYIRLMILPEIGGRIHVGLDLTNGYDFFYRQSVIKPALVGLLGPWVSGGVEFNWPQHHRPSTFMPTDWTIEVLPDGGRTVWLSEHEPMNRMKGMHGVTVRPGSAAVEVRVRLTNRTPFVQTFLWWANVAVAVHDRYQTFFPPDVTHVADHAKRATSTFPVSRGVYYGVDYGARPAAEADLSWYRNIPVPTSYMAMGTRDDFFGGYDWAAEAGLVHVADHHISPGKKQWTWGNHEFGHAWDHQLSDDGRPYVELMAGVFTDNQPDFSFLHPYETRTFRQSWYPIQRIGPAARANIEAALNLRVIDGAAHVGVCVTTATPAARVVLERCRTDGTRAALSERTADLRPGKPYLDVVELPPGAVERELRLTVRSRNGREIIASAPASQPVQEAPDPAREPPLPEAVSTTEELYLTGLHLEQYRHATRAPEAYWREALRREPGDSRSNVALGRWHLRRGEFLAAERRARRAVESLTRRNPNPDDGEPSYVLGQTLEAQGRLVEAEAAYAKAAWNAPWRSAGQYALARLAGHRGDLRRALEQVDLALAAGGDHAAARALKAALLRITGRADEARELIDAALALDAFDAWALAERQLSGGSPVIDLPGDVQTRLDVALDYASAGLLDDAIAVLRSQIPADPAATPIQPMVYYALGWFEMQRGDAEAARHLCQMAGRMPADYCFPSRLEEIAILEAAQKADPADARAPYYLGNLLYDRRRYADAIRQWERARQLDPNFPTVHRNLGIAEYNVRRRPARARAAYVRALRAAPDDARVLYEFDQLRKRLNELPVERLSFLRRRRSIVDGRDDLTIEYVFLLNLAGRHDEALAILSGRRFHPWEGGEGLVSGQWVATNLALGRAALTMGKAEEARRRLEAALQYPKTLGEGKHLLASENEVHYALGLAWRSSGDVARAKVWFTRAAERQGDPRSPVAESTYWRAVAMQALGANNEARRLLHVLQRAARTRLDATVRIDYFATSLPTLLVFDDDLGLRNRVECRYLEGLAHLGLGRRSVARAAFDDVLALDAAHVGAARARNSLSDATELGTSRRRGAP